MSNQIDSRPRNHVSYATKQGLERRKQLGQLCSGHKTILDYMEEHRYTRPRHRNSVIPTGGSIVSPKPPPLITYQTICGNGGRRIPAYYLGGRRVNALGFGLSDRDLAQIRKKSCRSGRGARANGFQPSSTSTTQLGCPSTAQPVSSRPKPSCPNIKPFPQPSPYFAAPNPPSYQPKLTQLPGGCMGQVSHPVVLDTPLDN